MHSRVLWAVLGVALVVSSVGPARAADAKPGEKSDLAKTFEKLDANKDGKLSPDELAKMHAEIAKDGKDVGMADLERYVKNLSKEETKIDLFKGWIDLSVYTIIVFLILFGILRAFAWGPIMQGLDKREQGIARDKADANRAKQEATKTRDELAAERSRANEEVRQKMEKARVDADALASERIALGKAELAAEKERLKREQGIAEDQARKEIFDQGARLATLISGKVIKKNLTYEDHRALLDEALSEFRAAGSARVSDLESATS